MSIKKFSFLLVITLFFTDASSLTYAEYNRQKREDSRTLCPYLFGLANGFIWGDFMESGHLEGKTKFCVSKQKIELNCLNFVALIDDRVKTYKSSKASAALVSDNSSVEPQFYMIIRETYPCD